MFTEQQNPNTQGIDQMDTLAMVRAINSEDQTVADAVARALPDIARAIDAVADSLRRGGRLFYVGAGTSGRLGILDASECPPTYGTPPEMVQGVIAGGEDAVFDAVESVEDDEAAGAADLRARDVSALDAVVGIAASGRTPYVLGALRHARSLGAVTIGISNNTPAAVLDAADIPIALVTGPEVITGSTRMKAGTAQKLVLNMISTGTMIKLGKVYGNLMVDVQVKNEKLLQRARRIVAHVGGVDEARAAELLDLAGRDVKTAIVTARRGVDAAEARALLAAADGFLRRVID
ncbi:MAG: N-acetylmuramic acid 6-phosphate etherase [Pleurocapsa minor GSE-CHR-MK-17-07R]|jgi:N-acetylmuramic acid 6-phosphate etherase|nr:N-acetylmuramic acid 6-phosphate etherase [Pleurocapsa minor GSE-CHR-MK 17-07R]